MKNRMRLKYPAMVSYDSDTFYLLKMSQPLPTPFMRQCSGTEVDRQHECEDKKWSDHWGHERIVVHTLTF